MLLKSLSKSVKSALIQIHEKRFGDASAVNKEDMARFTSGMSNTFLKKLLRPYSELRGEGITFKA